MPQVSGKFVSLKNGTLTLSHGVGKPTTTHNIDPSATCIIDSHEAKLADLQDGDTVQFTDAAVVKSVSATR